LYEASTVVLRRTNWKNKMSNQGGENIRFFHIKTARRVLMVRVV